MNVIEMTGPYKVVPDSDYLNRSIMKVLGPGAVCESIESAIEARRLANIANTAYAAGKRAVEGDLVLLLRGVLHAHNNGTSLSETEWSMVRAALASAGQEVKHGG